MSVRELLRQLKRRSLSTSRYWESRYEKGGSSGSGSFGPLAAYKASYVNQVIERYEVASVLELGCGDGRQIESIDYPEYIGVDVSPTAISMCRERHKFDPSKSFSLLHELSEQKVDLTVSMDVIYHLLENHTFEAHMSSLFAHSSRMVLIYSSDFEDQFTAAHIRHRRFSQWVRENESKWELIAQEENPFPYDQAHPDTTTFAEFHLFQRTG